MAMIDYGAVLIKNGKVMNENQFFMDMESSVGCKIDGIDGQYSVYAGDSEFVIATYKTVLRVAANGKLGPLWFGLDREDEYGINANKIIIHERYNGVQFTIKNIYRGVFHASFTYKGNFYNIIYGYGIDPDFSVWDDVKVRYLGVEGARTVDNLYKRLIKNH